MKHICITMVLLLFISHSSAMITEEDFNSSKPISIKELKSSASSSSDCKMPELNSSINSPKEKKKKTNKKKTTLKRSKKLETSDDEPKSLNHSSGESQSPERNSYRFDRQGGTARKKSFHPSVIGFLREDSDLEEKRKLAKAEFESRYPDNPEYIKLIEFIENETNTLHFDIKEKIENSEIKIFAILEKQKENENRWQQKALWGGLGASITLAIIGASNIAATVFMCGE